MTNGHSPVAGARTMIIGSGWRFTSGISYYTCRLTNELASAGPASALLMRRLVPRVMYPGRRRVGQRMNSLEYDRGVPVFDGVDWYWGRTMSQARKFMREQHPDVVVFQWWTGAVLHSYRSLAKEASRIGARIIIECHEVQDTGEARLPLAGRYVRTLVPRLFEMADGLLLHSEFDRKVLAEAFGSLDRWPVEIVPHGPYDFVSTSGVARPEGKRGVTRLLFFGTIRPYKGLEDLIRALDGMAPNDAAQYELSVVGETWEGWDLPLTLIEQSQWRDRITVVNRYVTDDEMSAAFAAADVVVLPYRRSSSSGPLHLAMAAGLPVVISDVGGLREAVEGYAGAVLTPPERPDLLAEAIARASAMVGTVFEDPRDWTATRDAIGRLAEPQGGDPIGREGRDADAPAAQLVSRSVSPRAQELKGGLS